MATTPAFLFPNAGAGDSPAGPAILSDIDTKLEAMAVALGHNTPDGVKRRGKSIIDAESSYDLYAAGVAYASAPTPDLVEDIVLEANGIIRIGFVALTKSTAGHMAAIFLNGTQLSIGDTAGAPALQEVTQSNGSNFRLMSTATGIGLVVNNDDGVAQSLVTTGQIVGLTRASAPDPVGGFLEVFAAAGTYNVSVKYKRQDASNNTLTLKSRKLWVEAVSY